MGEIRYQVEFSSRSLGDLEEIARYIAADNPDAAEQFGQRLISEAEAIAVHPLAGRTVPEFRDPLVRERIFRSYRIIYRLDRSRGLIIVSRFWHGARGTPDLGTA